MIVVKMYGGLGNQLFQYSFGKYLSLKYKTALKLNVDWFSSDKHKNETERQFEIDNFTLRFNGLYNKQSLQEKLIRKFIPLKTVNEKVFEDTGYDYAINAGNNIMLDGYWGSYLDYLFNPDFRKLISKELTVKKDSLNNLYFKFAQEITESENSVSISVRRGDFAGSILGTLDVNYYQRSIETITDRVKNPKYFVFGDDLDWVEQNFGFLKNKTVVQTNSTINDFNLIRLCRHNILANSTFGWWGAFLNNIENKTVIAPKNWFLGSAKSQAFHEQSRCIPIEWIRL